MVAWRATELGAETGDEQSGASVIILDGWSLAAQVEAWDGLGEYRCTLSPLAPETRGDLLERAKRHGRAAWDAIRAL